MKRYTLLSLLCIFAFIGCNTTPEPEEDITYTTLLIASKYGYIVDPCSAVPRRAYIIKELGGDEKWQPEWVLSNKVLQYEVGYEYTIKAHKEPYDPGYLTEANGVLFWKFDEVLDKVQKDTELPDNVYIYTIGSPWGFDPRDPRLEYMLEHYKEIFGEDEEIYYPTEY